MKVLLVDDEKNILTVLKAYLQQEGYQVTTALNGSIALTLFKENQYDLVLLDLMLPGLSGEQVCQEIRKISATPIIMLTAKIEEEDRISGLQMGADDYISKPFSPREVVARVRAVLRRSNTDLGLGPVADITTFDNNLSINNIQHEVRYNGEIIPLTPMEYKLLSVMARQPGRVFSRAQLIGLVQGYDFQGDDRVIDAHIKKMRQKIERVPSDPKIIVTVYGIGYKFNSEAEA
ncbi:response regulator [Desulfitobacterium sp. Sab5]|uniref:response regulator n=1 Tax=Desulfitobacterium nosdiversum TaxID=3375356 RepID=UPI003CF97A2C